MNYTTTDISVLPYEPMENISDISFHVEALLHFLILMKNKYYKQFMKRST